ncbi:MAG: hypothetical protein COB24_03675 [Hyphomicrobiales bacterium]|nr:MAG: hypothetical protein COB24_03675 [Hyphomicrobiales bacterium]
MKIFINQYFKFIFPLLLLLLLGRETAIFMAIPQEHYLKELDFFIPSLIENDEKKAKFSNAVAPNIANRKLAHIRYKYCARKLATYLIFDKPKVVAQRLQCLSILDDALAVAPSSALIWLEKAKLHGQQENSDELMNQSLFNAWHVAKRQDWVGLRRMVLSLQNWDKLSDVNKANAMADFMYFSPKSSNIVRSLAHQYLLNPAAKPIAEAWISQSEVQVQRQFIGFVRSGR